MEGVISKEQRRLRLGRLSRVARRLNILGMLLISGYCVFLLVDREALLAYLRRDVPGEFVIPADSALWAAYALSLVPAGILIAALWQAQRFFSLLGQAHIFDLAVPRILLRLSGLAIAVAVAEIVVRTLVVLLMTSANPPGQHQVLLGISSTDIGALIGGFLFRAFALMMVEAVSLDDENRSFV